MQDNIQEQNMDKGITDALTDRGWSDMKSILDKEMPIAKKNRKPWFFVFTGIVLLGIVSSFFILRNDSKTLESNLISKTDKDISSSSQNEKIKTTETPQLNRKAGLEATSQSVSKKENSSNKISTNTINEKSPKAQENSLSDTKQSAKTKTSKVSKRDIPSSSSQEDKRTKSKIARDNNIPKANLGVVQTKSITPTIEAKQERQTSTISSATSKNYIPFNKKTSVEITNQAEEDTKETPISIDPVIYTKSTRDKKADNLATKTSARTTENTTTAVNHLTLANIDLLKPINSSQVNSKTASLVLPASDKRYNPAFRTEDFIETEEDQKWNYYIQAGAGMDIFRPWVLSKPSQSHVNVGLIISRRLGKKFKLETGLSYYYGQRSVDKALDGNYFSDSFVSNYQTSELDTSGSIGTSSNPDELEVQVELLSLDRLQSLRYEGLDIPLHLRYQIRPKLSAHIGLNYQYYIYTIANIAHAGSNLNSLEDSVIEYRQSDKVKKYNMDSNIGLAYHPSDRFSFSLAHRTNLIKSPLKGVSSLENNDFSSDPVIDRDAVPLIDLPRYHSLELSARFRLR